MEDAPPWIGVVFKLLSARLVARALRTFGWRYRFIWFSASWPNMVLLASTKACAAKGPDPVSICKARVCAASDMTFDVFAVCVAISAPRPASKLCWRCTASRTPDFQASSLPWPANRLAF